MPSTNVEFVTELMEFSAHGALIQAFVMQALDTPMVSGHAWHGCAVEVRDKLARRLGRNDPIPPATAPTQRR